MLIICPVLRVRTSINTPKKRYSVLRSVLKAKTVTRENKARKKSCIKKNKHCLALSFALNAAR